MFSSPHLQIQKLIEERDSIKQRYESEVSSVAVSQVESESARADLYDQLLAEQNKVDRLEARAQRQEKQLEYALPAPSRATSPRFVLSRSTQPRPSSPTLPRRASPRPGSTPRSPTGRRTTRLRR